MQGLCAGVTRCYDLINDVQSLVCKEASSLGDPFWQPNAGKVDGALELDGVDDYVATTFRCDPSDGPISVLAWVKGVEAGRVILSQPGATNWIAADPSTEARANAPQASTSVDRQFRRRRDPDQPEPTVASRLL